MKTFTRILFLTVALFLLNGCYYSTSESHSSTTRKTGVVDSKTSPLNSLRFKVDSLLKIDKSREALELIEKSEYNTPFNVDIHTIKGTYYFRIKNYLKADEFLKKAAELSKNDYSQLSDLVGFYTELNELDSAKKYIELIIELYPKKAKTYNDLAAIQYELNNPLDSVLNNYKKAFTLNPGYYYSINDYAYLLLEHRPKTHLDTAIYYLRKCIDINSKYSLANYNLGKAYTIQKKYKLARKYLYAALKSMKNPNLIADMFYYLINNKQSELVIEFAEEFTDIKRLNNEVKNLFYINLGYAYLDTQNKDKACSTWGNVNSEYINAPLRKNMINLGCN